MLSGVTAYCLHAGVTGDQTHTYATSGDHTVAILGGLTRINLHDSASDSTNDAKLRSIDQWGDIGWTSMASAFHGAVNMGYTATDSPDLSGVTDMSNMFNDALRFNGDISNWNVSSVTKMSSMFSDATVFNQPLNNWDVSSVTTMQRMFFRADSFNQPLNNWGVSSVTNMYLMFSNADKFNQPLNNWDVSSVAVMDSMFLNTDKFNQPLNSWNVSSVTIMDRMFFNAADFNQPLNSWNVFSVTDMGQMFSYAADFNQPLNSWNVSSVTDMGQMFDNANSFDQNLGEWYVVANATSIARADVPGVVAEISAQNSELDGHTPTYDIGDGIDKDLFEIVGGNQLNMTSAKAKSSYTVNVTASDGSVFENDNNWHVLEITVTGSANMPPTVNAGTDQTVGEGDTVTLSGTATDPEGDAITSYIWSDTSGSGITFINASSASTTFTAPDVPSDTTYTFRLTVSDGTDSGMDSVDVIVKDTSGAFITTWRTASGGQSITIPVGGATGTYDVIWGDDTVSIGVTGDQTHMYTTSGDHTVAILGGFERIYLNGDANNAPKLRSIDQWGNMGWTSMASAFNGASVMTYGATDAPDLSRVTDMSNMFYNAAAFNGDISGWNVSGVTDMSRMFRDADVFNRPLDNWNVSGVTDMSRMFESAPAFTGDISGWNVSSVTYMAYMFAYAPAFNGDISRWNVSSVTGMESMFRDTAAFNGDISGWNVSSVTNMHSMFRGAAAFDHDLNRWNTSRVTDMRAMFVGASNFNGDISPWDVSSVTDMASMFLNANSFDQNLGEWYVVANSASIARADVPGVVAEISAQNSELDGHTPTYDIGDGIDKDLFEIVGGNQLNMTSADTKSSYTVNVTASDGSVFENDNNWHVLEITVTGSANMPPAVNAGTDQTVGEGDTVTLSGTATDSEGDAITSYTWSDTSGSGITFINASSASTTFTAPDVTSDTTFTFRLTASDGTDSGMDSVDVLVKDTSGAFITTWRTTSAGESITIPVGGATGTYDVIWGDDTVSIDVTGDQTHRYATSGNHTVAILGGFERIYLNNHADAPKLRSIDQWGNIGWTSMASAFDGTSAMTYGATDTPDLSRVTDMSGMFSTPIAFNGDISTAGTSRQSSTCLMFNGANMFRKTLGTGMSWQTRSSIATAGTYSGVVRHVRAELRTSKDIPPTFESATASQDLFGT